ncbi:MAG: ABC transporter substrate-binding protein [Xanthomonadales bacterium]|nr:ABC transporter substrate-binding protein [Xanthomonadales bacterium]
MSDPIRLRAGGVHEHYNFIWHRPETVRCWAHAGVAVDWTDYPGGTGAMVAALEAGELDLAPVLTEGAVAAAARGATIRIISTYVESPLRWGVHVAEAHPAQSIDDLRGTTFAISREGSGSQLMAAVMAEQRGWPLESLKFATVGDLEGARAALPRGEADGFLWELYTTKHLVDSGEWRRIGVVTTPWPSFVIVAAERVIEDEPEALLKVLRCLDAAFAAVRRSDAEAFIASRYELLPEDVASWRSQTEWRLDWRHPEQDLCPVVGHLVKAGQLEARVDPATVSARLLDKLRE